MRDVVRKTLVTALGLAVGNGSMIQAAETLHESSRSASVSFDLRRGRIMVPVRVNGSEPLSFLLDTGYSLTMISPRHAEALGLKRTGAITIAGIAGNEETDVFTGAKLDLGRATYQPRRVAALPPGGDSRRRDGVLGSGFFRQFVVEIDLETRKLTLHSPDKFTYAGTGEVCPLSFRNTTPIIEAAVQTPGGSLVKANFEIDTGCTGGLCLGRDFVDQHKLIESDDSTRSSARQGVGGDARTKVGRLPQLRLGRQVVAKPTANFFLEGSPVDAGLAGHIGMEVLRQFKVIFDYSRRQMILEPIPAEGAKR